MNDRSQYESKRYDRLQIQIRPEVRDKLAVLAKQNHLSMSKLIVEAMEDVYNLDLHTPREVRK